ncbi:MAG: MotA/TolQ/ExbB proton channel family protein [Sphaerochaetaceae bacterium]|jgi:biopolymer transport protein ExbB/TolQ
MVRLIELMDKGGVVMWPLYALFIGTIVLFFERAVTLLFVALGKEVLQQKRFQTSLSALDLIASIAPVLGFLGTVTGMIAAFKSIAAESSVQIQHLAAGLYEALFTTAFGLIISLIAAVLSFILEFFLEKVCEKEEEN